MMKIYSFYLYPGDNVYKADGDGCAVDSNIDLVFMTQKNPSSQESAKERNKAEGKATLILQTKQLSLCLFTSLTK